MPTWLRWSEAMMNQLSSSVSHMHVWPRVSNWKLLSLEQLKRTLHMLHNKHTKAGNDLERKIAKLREEGKDPALRQKVDPPQVPHSTRFMPNVPPLAPSSPPQRSMNDLQNTVDESFMLLGGQRSDPGDAFNQFWNIMQGMLDNLSQPVAFATALGMEEEEIPQDTSSPLSTASATGSFSGATDAVEPLVSRFKRRIGFRSSRDGSTSPLAPSSPKAGPSRLSHSPSSDDLDDDLLEAGDDLSESFYMIPGGVDPSPAALKRENVILKADIDSLQTRLEAAERMLQLRKEQDQQLRDSIVMARREAQRVMSVSMLGHRPPAIDLGALNLNVPPIPIPIPSLNSGREAQYTRRIKELEDEVRVLRVDNEKQKAMITKFRERWEKLKDSAKRKKEAKAAAASTPIKERIVEEPEAEQELDEANQ
ncbi:hypothetical protein HGRIS_013268 [Hohenbuehelia grisea]|uniref:Uncharacterized protein n=1 Tax=Hohenbuehelia grisea TaxID=104357 RepID=A0ABR3IV12_9AGAR